MKKENIIFAVILFAVLLVSRLVPHPANFTALTAVALFSGSFWKNSQLRFIIPLAVMFVTDLYIGLYPGAMWTYAAVVLGVLVAPSLLASMWRVLASGLAASIIFFIVSNMGVWWAAELYPHTIAGLADCFIQGVPFFRTTVISTAFYSVVLYGIYRLTFAPMGLQGFFRLNYGRYQR